MPNSFLCLLLVDLDDAAGGDGAATLTDREPQTLIHRDRVDQLHPHLRVVSRHHHLSPLRQRDQPGDIRRPEIELRPIPTEERVMPAPLLLGQHIHLSIELRVRRDRPRHTHHLTPLHIILTRPPQQQPHIVPSTSLIQQLTEHLHTRHRRPLRRTDPHDLHLRPNLQNTLLHPTRHHRAPTRNRKHILDRHLERLVHITRRLRNIRIHRPPQPKHKNPPPPIPPHPLQRRPPHHRHLITRKLILSQKIPNLQLHQIQQLRIIHHVDLVQKHHDVRDTHLTEYEFPGDE